MPVPRLTWIPLVALALLASPALASPCANIPQFDAALAAEPTIRYLKPALIISTCDPVRAFEYIFACADEVTNTVYLTNPANLRYIGWTEREITCLERHERAHLWHVDGTRWAGDHRSTVKH